ncbi:MAG: hypothetical protein COA93_06475 [Alphaproteobacteria bacterium]|nr:MAG: hypothetical protein COA93_06475 [Alphaproteobacteria bacterium]
MPDDKNPDYKNTGNSESASLHEFSRPIDVTTVGKNGRQFNFQATEAEKTALALRFDVLEIIRLNANADITPAKKGQYKLMVSYNVKLNQACSISLETVTDDVSGNFTVILQHPPREPNKQSQKEDLEVDFDYEESDFEYINSNLVDVGELIAQYISLEINPYPRKSGVTGEELRQKIIQEKDANPSQGKKSPFAVLKSLKHKA